MLSDSELRSIFEFAAAIWPHDASTKNPAVREAWGRLLKNFTAGEVFGAYYRLAESDRGKDNSRAPSLAEVRSTAQTIKREAKAEREAQDAPRIALTWSLAGFIASMRKSREEKWERLEKEVAKYDGEAYSPWSRNRIERHRAQINVVGPYEAAAFRNVRASKAPLDFASIQKAKIDPNEHYDSVDDFLRHEGAA